MNGLAMSNAPCRCCLSLGRSASSGWSLARVSCAHGLATNTEVTDDLGHMAPTHHDDRGQCRSSGAGPHGPSAAVALAVYDPSGVRGRLSRPTAGLRAGNHVGDPWHDRGVQGRVVVCQGRSTTMTWHMDDMQNQDNG